MALSVYAEVGQVAEKLEVPFIVVGAAARDIVMHYEYGADISRATRDIDFAVQVENDRAYEAIKNKLIENGYKETKKSQRLVSNQGIEIDIVPFGGLEDADGHILLPPDKTHKMSVLGFKEAYEYADLVIMKKNPKITIPVASPEGLALLKIIAWLDRSENIRAKDALDIYYLLRNYEEINEVRNALYESESEVFERFNWDITKTASYLLGKRVSEIASANTKIVVTAMIDDSVKLDLIVSDMCSKGFNGNEFESKRVLMEAFIEGFGFY